MTDREALKAARFLEAQHPSPWTWGEWYNARLPNKRPVQIKRTEGRGRNAGRSYLHVRKWARIVLVNPADGTRTPAGEGWDYFRIDLRTGAVTQL